MKIVFLLVGTVDSAILQGMLSSQLQFVRNVYWDDPLGRFFPPSQGHRFKLLKSKPSIDQQKAAH